MATLGLPNDGAGSARLGASAPDDLMADFESPKEVASWTSHRGARDYDCVSRLAHPSPEFDAPNVHPSFSTPLGSEWFLKAGDLPHHQQDVSTAVLFPRRKGVLACR